MKRRTLALSLTALIILVAVAAWFLVPKSFLPGLITGPSPTPTTAPPELSDASHAAMNLYIAGPDKGLPQLNRVELTLTKAEVKRGDGKSFTIFNGATRLVIEAGVSQKALNVMMPAGPYGTLTLTFLPTAAFIAEDGMAQTAYLPNYKMSIALHEDVPTSRTLTMLAHLDLAAGLFGTKSNVPTYQLPETLSVETYTLGGIFRNDRAIGAVWAIPKPTLTSVVKKDLNLDIAAPMLPGTPTFNQPTGPPQAATPPPR